MRYSKMFGKTVHQVAKDITNSGHRFLYQGGFVREHKQRDSEQSSYLTVDKLLELLKDETINRKLPLAVS